MHAPTVHLVLLCQAAHCCGSQVPELGRTVSRFPPMKTYMVPLGTMNVLGKETQAQKPLSLCLKYIVFSAIETYFPPEAKYYMVFVFSLWYFALKGNNYSSDEKFSFKYFYIYKQTCVLKFLSR